MHGNTPYAGLPGTAGGTGGGDESIADLQPDQKRRLERDLSLVVERIQRFLPDDYAVGSELSVGLDGVQATVAVQPPVGDVVSAGFTPNIEQFADGAAIDRADREEVARGLAASAAFQVKQALDDDLTPTAQ